MENQAEVKALLTDRLAYEELSRSVSLAANELNMRLSHLVPNQLLIPVEISELERLSASLYAWLARIRCAYHFGHFHLSPRPLSVEQNSELARLDRQMSKFDEDLAGWFVGMLRASLSLHAVDGWLKFDDYITVSFELDADVAPDVAETRDLQFTIRFPHVKVRRASLPIVQDDVVWLGFGEWAEEKVFNKFEPPSTRSKLLHACMELAPELAYLAKFVRRCDVSTIHGRSISLQVFMEACP